MPMSRDASNSDELPVQQSLLFSESLKDLKNLRTQLYSAAEYFEVTYTNDDQKQMVVETLKDYTIKALVNTVDHLGSLTFKVNDLLDEEVEAVSGTELRVSCIEQRLRTSRAYIDREGISQQSLVVNTPKYHKRYILPVGETITSANRTTSKLVGCGLDDEDDWHQLRNAVRATIRDSPTSSVTETPMSIRKGRSLSPSPRPPQQSPVFSFMNTMPKKEQEKRTESPHRFQLLRSGSVSRPTTPNKNRLISPIAAGAMQRHPSEPRKSASMRLQSEKDSPKDIDQSPGKSKRLLKALLSRRKSKKDEMLYTYLDEY
ncbi:ABL interactor-like protein 2 [Hibiscus trionum]|uniref:ABL interactor-like protein 2 n=1 Tax=Hibiscus trionum TaxID=183268 RepID=A0A9W7LQE2_HIBTR|nr:ABL interactor-like protein 2 [Hibiscus trionum]